MRQLNQLNVRVMLLDTNIKKEADPKVLKVAHDYLLSGLRESGKGGYKYPDPDWDQYPLARDFFTQRYP